MQLGVVFGGNHGKIRVRQSFDGRYVGHLIKLYSIHSTFYLTFRCKFVQLSQPSHI